MITKKWSSNETPYYTDSTVFPVFTDIETTGLSREKSSITLIGCCYPDKDSYTFFQWLNEDGNSEQAILAAFLSLLATFSKEKLTFVHFNGTYFDLPFLKEKCKLYGLSFPEVPSVDLFLYGKSLKNLFCMDSQTQTSFEELFSLQRTDLLSGKKLISVYHKIKKEGTKDAVLDYCKHNEKDLFGLLYLTRLWFLHDFLEKKIKPEDVMHYDVSSFDPNAHLITFTCTFPGLQIKRIRQKKGAISMSWNDSTLSVSIKSIHETLLYFFKNYKDYYYLPKEDRAIHKSIALFVEKEYRQKARKDNCYIRKEGEYLPYFSSFLGDCFYRAPKQKEVFISFEECLSWNSTDAFCYLNDVIQHFS